MPHQRSGPYLTDCKPVKADDPDGYHRWRRSCAGKVRFQTEDSTKRVGGAAYAYHCEFCKYWHMASPKNPRSKGQPKAADFPVSETTFKYRTIKGKAQVFKRVDLARRTFSFFLLEPDSWSPQAFLDLIWQHAGYMVEEVQFVERYEHPERGLTKHTYDLYFRSGRGFTRNSKEINAIMWEIEKEMRATMKIEMKDTHQPPLAPTPERALLDMLADRPESWESC